MKVPDRQTAARNWMTSEDVRTKLRAEIPAADKWAYFDHAAVSPIPREAARAASKMLSQCSESGDFHWPDWSASASRLRKNAACLIHTEPKNIALIPNTTFGINLIANTFPWFEQQDSGIRESALKSTSEGLDGTHEHFQLRALSNSNLSGHLHPPNVVVIENEFSSNLLPWENLASSGVEVRKVRVGEDGIVSLDEIRRLLDKHTKLVSISWVNYLTGYRIDLAKVCELVHEHGAQLFLDAIQGLGVFPCDVTSIPIDYLAADGHKWLLGPEGAGIMYIRPERLPSLSHSMLGWNSLKAAHQFNNDGVQFKEDASRFEGGSANHVGLIALEQSTNLLLDLGAHLPKNGVEGAVLENAASLREGLRSIGATVYCDEQKAAQMSTDLSGIVSFNLPAKDPMAVRAELIQHKVICSVRHSRVRLATHAYNDLKDIDTAIDVLRRLV